MGTKLKKLLALNLDERTWIRHLPNSLSELVRVVGLETTLKIAVRYGGTQMYVPSLNALEAEDVSDGLIGLIGIDATERLIHHFGFELAGCGVAVPSCVHGRVWRRLRWLSLMNDGLPEREAGQLIGISRSTLYAWKKLYMEPAR